MARRSRSVTVRPADDGGWLVVIGKDASGSRHERKRDATLRGRELLRREGGGELVIHSVSGRIVDRDRVPPLK
jgi:hypothetical protein